MVERMVERQKKNDKKNRMIKDKWWMERRMVERQIKMIVRQRKNMEKKDKKKIFCIIDLL